MDISYLGTNYHGWQVQNNAITVQQKINEALSILTSDEIKCMGSGRTDTGVHALQQIAHFDTSGIIDEERIKHKLNGLLPLDISVNSVYRVNEKVSARFDAISRSYIYKIHQAKTPFLIDKSYFYSKPLDLKPMNEACILFQKHKDFQAFSMVKTDVNHFNCDIFEINFTEENGHILFYVSANRFLRGMVRTIVGTMLEIGEGKIDLKDLEDILLSKDRKKAGRAVPSHGLYLNSVKYPKEIMDFQ